MPESVRLRNKKTGDIFHVPIIDDETMREVLYDGDMGWCIACGTDTSGVEPDARKYKCENCGERMVYGMEELMMMGLYRIPKENRETPTKGGEI